MQYTRNVHFEIKPDRVDEFNRVFKTDVLPVLKKQKGFLNEITMLDGTHGVGISFWDSKPSVESYHKTSYPELLKKLESTLVGAPTVKTYNVAYMEGVPVLK